MSSFTAKDGPTEKLSKISNDVQSNLYILNSKGITNIVYIDNSIYKNMAMDKLICNLEARICCSNNSYKLFVQSADRLRAGSASLLVVARHNLLRIDTAVDSSLERATAYHKPVTSTIKIE